MKLGKKLGVVKDRRTFKVADLLTTEAPKPPAEFHIGGSKLVLPMYRNDAIGDCGLASQGHRIVAQERSSGQARKITLTDDDVVAAYSAVSGYDPSTGANDNGVYLLDVCNYMRKTGMGTEKDGTPHQISAFAAVNHSTQPEVELACWMFGGLYVGAGLPLSAQDQVGDVWDLTGDARADAWGSWGGHAMTLLGFDEEYVYLSTWASVQKATWAWWNAFVDESYALLSEDYFRTHTEKTPAGFDVDRLNQQLAQL